MHRSMNAAARLGAETTAEEICPPAMIVMFNAKKIIHYFVYGSSICKVVILNAIMKLSSQRPSM
eukprot:6064349-Lingulodinium_polyedra.AAC.1